MQIAKPVHRNYILRSCKPDNYTKYAEGYSRAKRYGIRASYTWLSGVGLWGVVIDVAKGEVVWYGKRKIAVVVIGACSTVSAPAIAVLTNYTKAKAACQAVYSTTTVVAECCEDLSNVPFLMLDYAVFGQPISIGEIGQFNKWQNVHDIINETLSILD